MSYMALYRKWRPGLFQDVKGQEHIVTTLKNQINADRIGHAYLFCGTRGTGKTTVAKLFAKAVNCEHPVDGDPCNECASCLAINSQSSMNIIEIDAASNNGVDNIREIRDEVQYSPAEGKYKVYIIDEVHMLSIGAFNALLKTLEEPPSYVIFILATTEAHKIPITILSRCQRYDFRRISIDIIAGRLNDLMVREQLEVEDKAIRYVAKAADGSMRDALSLLDQCIAFYLGQKLTYDNVLEVLGAVDTAVFGQLLERILNQKAIGVMELIEEITTAGRDLLQFINDFIWYLRNLLLLKNSEGAEEVLDMSSENLMQLQEDTKMIDSEALMRYIRILSELSSQLKYATQKRVMVEVAFLKLCKPQMETDLGSIVERLRELEKRVEQGITINVDSNRPSAVPSGKQEETSGEKYDIDAELDSRFEPADADTLKQIIAQWKSFGSSLEGPMRTFFREAKVTVGQDGSVLNLVFRKNNTMAKEYFDRESHLLDLEHKLSDRCGKAIKLQILYESSEQKGGFENYDLSNALEQLKTKIPIEYVNE